MKTRTLLLLALGCGVAIMFAGAVFLFQLSTSDELEPATPIGEAARVGDMTVTVLGASEQQSDSVMLLSVDVEIGGVEDRDGDEGFRLIASGRGSRDHSGTCGATSVESARCTLVFDVSLADGRSRVLFYERGDQQLRWVLDQP